MVDSMRVLYTWSNRTLTGSGHCSIQGHCESRQSAPMACGHCCCLCGARESCQSAPTACSVLDDPHKAASLGYARESVVSPEVDCVSVEAVVVDVVRRVRAHGILVAVLEVVDPNMTPHSFGNGGEGEKTGAVLQLSPPVVLAS